MNTHILNFILINIIVIGGFIYIAFIYHNKTALKNKEKKRTFIEFINSGQKLTMKSVLIGLSFGIVFGFMDNFGLWLGIDRLEKYMPGGVKTKAALGNTYSDFLGSTLGTSVSIMLNDYFDNEENTDQPIWLNTIGIVLGCFIGLFAGRLIIGGN
jgi:hypothetical protein